MFKVGLSTGVECPKYCSNPCYFCTKETYIDAELAKQTNVTAQINYMIGKIKNKVKAGGYIAYFQDGTSFSGDPLHLYNVFNEAAKHPDILELIISTRPDCLPIDLLNLLCNISKPITIELGVQTVNEKSLKYLNRGHTHKENQAAIDLLLKYSFKIGVHIILGIPDESIVDVQKTLAWINNNNIIKDVKIHHLAIFCGSKLATMVQKEDIIDLDSYIKILSYFITHLRKDLTISRLFTSNLNRQQIMLNQFPGFKRTWINKFMNYHKSHKGKT